MNIHTPHEVIVQVLGNTFGTGDEYAADILSALDSAGYSVASTEGVVLPELVGLIDDEVELRWRAAKLAAYWTAVRVQSGASIDRSLPEMADELLYYLKNGGRAWEAAQQVGDQGRAR